MYFFAIGILLSIPDIISEIINTITLIHGIDNIGLKLTGYKLNILCTICSRTII